MTTAVYAAIVEGDQDGGYGAFFPDLPGCVTAAETQFELMAAAREALSLHLSGMIEDGEALPHPTPIEALKADPDVTEVARILVDAEIDEPLVRVNVSIGAAMLRRIDVAAEARGMTRSGFLVASARSVMEGPPESGIQPVQMTSGVGDYSLMLNRDRLYGFVGFSEKPAGGLSGYDAAHGAMHSKAHVRTDVTPGGGVAESPEVGGRSKRGFRRVRLVKSLHAPKSDRG